VASSGNGKPPWIEITVRIDPPAHEALSTFFFDLGCEGVQADDISLRTYLPGTRNADEIRGRITDFLGLLEEIFTEISPPRLEIEHIEEKDWGLLWRRFFKPQQVTESLLILPPWEPRPQDPEGHVILMDPGPAFGTGRHPTTRMCLLAMEKILPPTPWSMLDVGTGSGILAIYAAKLGARRIVGIDTDPEAVRWAKRNRALNHLDDRIEISDKSLESWNNPFSLIAANLTLNIILELLHRFSGLLIPGGLLILSGLLNTQLENLEGPLATRGLTTEEILHEREWAALITRKGSARLKRE
jgi:ribosomal protein L11 methyltransferase